MAVAVGRRPKIVVLGSKVVNTGSSVGLHPPKWSAGLAMPISSVLPSEVSADNLAADKFRYS